MADIRRLTDMEAAFDFYHTYSVASPREERPADGYPPALGLMPVSRGTIDYWFAGDDRITFGAYEGDRLVGIASGNIAPARKAGYLSYLCVAPDRRHRGIATALCDRLEDNHFIGVENVAAGHFREKFADCGFSAPRHTDENDIMCFLLDLACNTLDLAVVDAFVQKKLASAFGLRDQH